MWRGCCLVRGVALTIRVGDCYGVYSMLCRPWAGDGDACTIRDVALRGSVNDGTLVGGVALHITLSDGDVLHVTLRSPYVK